jgi:hypothetical protein
MGPMVFRPPEETTAGLKAEGFAGPHFRDGYKKGYKIALAAPTL